MSPATVRRAVGVWLLLLGITELVLAAFMLLAPGAFFASLGPFGLRNDHYIQDSAAFEAAIGVAALLALWRPGWRVPVLVVATLHFGLHAVSHLIDVGEARPVSVGVADLVSLTVLAVVCGALAHLAARRSDSGRR